LEMGTFLERDGKSLNLWITGQGRLFLLKMHHETSGNYLSSAGHSLSFRVPSSWTELMAVLLRDLSSCKSLSFSQPQLESYHPPWSWLVVSKLPCNMLAPNLIPMSEQHTVGRRKSTSSGAVPRK